jgi:ABC-type bacteriocin/lantibiotic exporter with double-glycine peptidase domain
MNIQQTPRPKSGFFYNFGQLLDASIPFRRVQLAATFLLTFVGAVAELCTIGAVLPVLAIASKPDRMSSLPLVGPLLTFIAHEFEVGPVIAAALFLTIAAIGATLIRLLLMWASQKFVFGLQQDLSLAVFGRGLRQPYIQYLRQNSSVLISSQQKISVVVGGILTPLMQALTSVVMASFISIFLFILDPRATSVAAASIGITYFLITLYTRAQSRVMSAGLSEVHGARIQMMQETLGGIRDINLDQSQPVFEVRLLEIENNYRRLALIANLLSSAPRLMVEGVAIVLVAVMAGYFSLQPGGVLGALPVLGALALGAQRMLPMIQMIYLGYAQYSLYSGNLTDLVGLLTTPVEDIQAIASVDVRRFAKSIELRDLSFNYGEGRDALTHINLTIPKGARTGFIGKTGSGKSTVVDIIMGLLEPTQGTLRVDDLPIDRSSIGNWKAQIAHVPQAIFLSDATIEANIAFGSRPEDIDRDRVRIAAEHAGLSEFVDTLDAGLLTMVGERGVRLSGGQRQRIGIARALYKRATVLVLDEATSALDDETEAAVMASVADLDRELTVIMIAHRLSTVAHCDRVFRLAAGRIIASGTYAEVTGAMGQSAPLGVEH